MSFQLGLKRYYCQLNVNHKTNCIWDCMEVSEKFTFDHIHQTSQGYNYSLSWKESPGLFGSVTQVSLQGL